MTAPLGRGPAPAPHGTRTAEASPGGAPGEAPGTGSLPLLIAPTTLLPGVTRRDALQPSVALPPAAAPARAPAAPLWTPARPAGPGQAPTGTSGPPPDPATRYGATVGPAGAPVTRFGAVAVGPPGSVPATGRPSAPAPVERTLSAWSIVAVVVAALTLVLWFLCLPCGLLGAAAVAREKKTGTGTTVLGFAAVVVAVGARLCMRVFETGSPLF